ncbi:unnamed protein product [Moneuplotes crassus]|uniref:RING-type domain-containing protein n=1 Tax=Euplotes crassus TaxID=5936 RepID=A0AAD1U8L8_EUPCR|nr:unnamed protein product [Moneuplotes crassus]
MEEDSKQSEHRLSKIDLEANLCIICYVNPVQTQLECGFDTCLECLVNWIKANIYFNTVNERNYTCKCPDSTCNHTLTSEEITSVIMNSSLGASKSSAYLAEINDQFMFFYISNKEDLRKCPNDGCGYAGIISFQKCTNSLICEKCNYEWVDPIHKPGISTGGILSLLKPGGDKQVLSYFWEVLFGKPCPGCSVTIYKDFGCSVMNCSLCKTEFCWLCQGKTQNHGQHFEGSICPGGYFITHASWIFFLVFGVNSHLYYRFEGLRSIELSVAYYTLLIILSIFFLITFNSLLSLVADNCKRKHYFCTAFTCIFPLLVIAILCVWARLTNFGFTLAIICLIIELAIILLICAISSFGWLDKRMNRHYHEFQDEVPLRFDAQVHPVNLNKDLDILRENSMDQARVEQEVLARAEAKPKRKMIKRKKSTGLKKKKPIVKSMVKKSKSSGKSQNKKKLGQANKKKKLGQPRKSKMKNKVWR